jgi:prepilin-type N-terminal cleavage/methylation domain-containing protein
MDTREFLTLFKRSVPRRQSDTAAANGSLTTARLAWRMRASSRHGFTLIELSIVLVIIGLLVGGILVGRDLIRVAELRADISAVDKFDAAVNTFRVKYNCLPGDCANATQFLEGAYNGNGNGVIEPHLAPGEDLWGYYIGYEIAYAVDDLARANLIAVAPFEANNPLVTDYTDKALPPLPSGSAFVVVGKYRFLLAGGVWAQGGKHIYRLGVSNAFDGGGIPEGIIKTTPAPYTPHDAYYIDSKIDDGIAYSGRVTAGLNQTFDYSILLPNFYDTCEIIVGDSWDYGLNEDTCEYDLTVKEKVVGLFVQGSF